MALHGTLYGTATIVLCLAIASAKYNGGLPLTFTFFFLAGLMYIYGIAWHYEHNALRKGVMLALCTDLVILTLLLLPRLFASR